MKISAGLLFLALLSACRDRDVVAEVGKTTLRESDLAAHLSRTPTAGRSRSDALAELVDRTLLAEGARQEGLLDQQKVRARVAAAEREALAQAMLDRLAAAAGSDDAGLRQLYDREKARLARRRIHLAQIFIRFPGGDIARANLARARAARIHELASQGRPFDALARAESDDKASAAAGGDLGPIFEGEVDPAFFAAASVLKQGELGKPVETSFGIHLLRALEDPVSVTPTFEESKGRLAAGARRDGEAKLLTRLRSEIAVKTYGALAATSRSR